MKEGIILNALTELDIEIIAEFERTLIGRQCGIDSFYFAGKTPEAKQHSALVLIQYVVEYYLEWSPQKMYESLDMEIMKQWRLHLLLKYIHFPEVLNKEHNVNYLAHIIYPESVPMSAKDICLIIYQQIVKGDIKRFPKNFFAGPKSMDQACICLKYAIDNFLSFTTSEELYDFFGTSQCLRFLRDYKLNICLKEQFDAPITAVHLIVPPIQSEEFLFQYYRFWQIFNEQLRQEEEVRGKKPVHEHKSIAKEDAKYVQPVY